MSKQYATVLSQPAAFENQRNSSNAIRWTLWVRQFNTNLKVALNRNKTK